MSFVRLQQLNNNFSKDRAISDFTLFIYVLKHDNIMVLHLPTYLLKRCNDREICDRYLASRDILSRR